MAANFNCSVSGLIQCFDSLQQHRLMIFYINIYAFAETTVLNQFVCCKLCYVNNSLDLKQQILDEYLYSLLFTFLSTVLHHVIQTYKTFTKKYCKCSAQKVESNHWAYFISYGFEVRTPYQWRSSTHIF